MMRRAQLVRHVGGQVAPALVRSLQLGRHAVERLRQPPELAGAVGRHRHPRAEISVGDAVGGRHHVGQRGRNVPKAAQRQPCRHQGQRQR